MEELTHDDVNATLDDHTFRQNRHTDKEVKHYNVNAALTDHTFRQVSLVVLFLLAFFLTYPYCWARMLHRSKGRRVSSPTATHCMPPRQTWRRDPPTAPPAQIAPLNEGFAAAPSTRPTAQTSRSTPLRRDGGGIMQYTRGSKRSAVEIASDPIASSAAAERLRQRVYAESNKGPHAQRLATWTAVATAAGYTDPFAADPDLLYHTAAALWQAGYRSIDTYLSAVRQQMLLDHGDLPESISIHFRRISRAAARGRGPARQATGLPFARLAELPDTVAPLVLDGPCFPRRAAVVASWWLLRETEFANLALDMVTFADNTVTVRLPMSKEDPRGMGTTRTLGCACKSQLADLCPFHVLYKQVDWATAQANTLNTLTSDFPLFPTINGKPTHKKQVSATVQAIAANLNLPLTAPTGAPLYSGHSFRVTGAQFLASCGIDIWRIQLHGRWGSSSVLRYIRLSPLAPTLALEAALGRDLRQVQKAITAARAELESTADDTALLQQKLEAAMGPEPTVAQDVLGKPDVAQVIQRKSANQFRAPTPEETLVASRQRNSRGTKWHAVRPLASAAEQGTIEAFSASLLQHGGATECGWQIQPDAAIQLRCWGQLRKAEGCLLCTTCFGKLPSSSGPSTSSSSDTSESV